MKKNILLVILLYSVFLNAAVYVDVNNTTGPWNGTERDPYRTIQQGLNVAMGDVSVTEVIVADGTYFENLIIYPIHIQNMSNIVLRSANLNPSTCCIFGNGFGSVITMGNQSAFEESCTVSIVGFSIKDSGSQYTDSAITSRINSHLENNHIYECSRAITADWDACSRYGTVNIIDNKIYNNTLANSPKIVIGQIVNVNISDNSVINNFGTAISVRDCENTIIDMNNIEDNLGGILVQEISDQTYSRDYDITNNTIQNNLDFGIKNHESREDLGPSLTNMYIIDNIIQNHSYSIILDYVDVIEIYNNIVTNSDVGVKIIRDSVTQGNFEIDLHHNTIADNDYGFYSEYSLALLFAPDPRENIFWNNNLNDICYDVPPSTAVTLDYNCIQDLNNLPTYVINATGNIDSNPRFTDPANGDYTLSADSPCIDSGDPSSNLDVDGTRKDIGCYPVDQDLITHTRTLDAGWNWLCFPRLKRVDEINGNINQPTFGTGKFIGSLWNDTVTGYTPFSIDGNSSNDPAWLNGDWSPENYVVESIEGFKLNMSGTATENQVGALDSPDTEIQLTNLDTKPAYIGYILAEPGLITHVVPADMLQYKFHIQAEDWCATYDPTSLGGRYWKFDTSSEPEIKCGDMIALKMRDAPNGNFTFQWQEPQTTRRDYDGRPMPEYFSFIEQENYLPLFLELDCNNLPQEIGLYIDGECKGAAVVNQNQTEEAICQINAYILEEPEENLLEELEIVYYDGARNSVKTYKEYAVYNQENADFFNQNLVLADMLGQDEIIITMQKGDYEEAPETDFDFRSRNYPNPFNPTTEIYFSLPTTSDTSLEIYNVKGQKVKTLVNGQLDKGEHQISWDGTDSSRNPVSNGIYFYRLQSGKKMINKKMILLK